jgi:hypothetical protein
VGEDHAGDDEGAAGELGGPKGLAEQDPGEPGGEQRLGGERDADGRGRQHTQRADLEEERDQGADEADADDGERDRGGVRDQLDRPAPPRRGHAPERDGAGEAPEQGGGRGQPAPPERLGEQQRRGEHERRAGPAGEPDRVERAEPGERLTDQDGAGEREPGGEPRQPAGTAPRDQDRPDQHQHGRGVLDRDRDPDGHPVDRDVVGDVDQRDGAAVERQQQARAPRRAQQRRGPPGQHREEDDQGDQHARLGHGRRRHATVEAVLGDARGDPPARGRGADACHGEGHTGARHRHVGHGLTIPTPVTRIAAGCGRLRPAPVREVVRGPLGDGPGHRCFEWRLPGKPSAA